MILSTSQLYGQLSPGDLSSAHAHLEGLSNCTQCHDIGNKIPDQKCLACHEDIQNLINQGRGFHASSEVKNKNCVSCHSDHHGRKFDMVRFDQDAFEHALTGYELEGQHAVIDCRECHIPDFINDPEIRKRENTFLGVDQECLSCHDDFHQSTLSEDCASCHNTEAFRPAPFFDHDEARFALNGEHVNVDCIECHAETFRNGEKFQQFTDLKFADCVSCHDDPHQANWVADCKTCHVESSFQSFNGRKNFDHNTTEFTLRGSHKNVDCFECHKNTQVAATIFQDRSQVSENNCASCHDDVHEGKFGNDCAKCHQETKFNDLKTMDFFDHAVTDYPLEGMHVSVDCKECHTSSYTDAIDFSMCKNCHEDYHHGEFADNGNSPDCVECHSLIEGFEIPQFTIEQHQQTDFPLEGAHIATPCFACHVDEREEWTFRNIGNRCVDCHQDIHQEFISEEFYPDQECKACHISEAWVDVNFNHSLTDWPLTGKHQEVTCRSCHIEESETDGDLIQKFNGLDHTCSTCHDNIHGDQFAMEGITDCQRCHTTESWSGENFDHDSTAFPLEGKHAEITCAECHKPQLIEGKEIIEYKIENFQCIDCHM